MYDASIDDWRAIVGDLQCVMGVMSDGGASVGCETERHVTEICLERPLADGHCRLIGPFEHHCLCDVQTGRCNKKYIFTFCSAINKTEVDRGGGDKRGPPG